MLVSMDKLQVTGQNLGQVFNIRGGHLHAAAFLVSSVKLPYLQVKTWPKQLLGYLPLDIALPIASQQHVSQLQKDGTFNTEKNVCF